MRKCTEVKWKGYWDDKMGNILGIAVCVALASLLLFAGKEVSDESRCEERKVVPVKLQETLSKQAVHDVVVEVFSRAGKIDWFDENTDHDSKFRKIVSDCVEENVRSGKIGKEDGRTVEDVMELFLSTIVKSFTGGQNGKARN